MHSIEDGRYDDVSSSQGPLVKVYFQPSDDAQLISFSRSQVLLHERYFTVKESGISTIESGMVHM